MSTALHDPADRARYLPTVGFVVALLGLATLALLSLRAPAGVLTGLPDEPTLQSVQAVVSDRLRVDCGELRFHSALLSERGEPDVALAVEIDRALAATTFRNPREPRLRAALASLSLAAGRAERAERLYRQVLDVVPRYGEARLGLGMALELRADAQGSPSRARGLRLRAISQFAAVPEADPAYEAALFDRALLLRRVGRADEALVWAHAYLRRDARSSWAARLRRELGE